MPAMTGQCIRSRKAVHMGPRASHVFHFTRNLTNLMGILEHGFYPHGCLEDLSWLGGPGYNAYTFLMVCFCDIPLSRLTEHVEFYGNYGIGLSRRWALDKGLNPVLYFSPQAPLCAPLLSAMREGRRLQGNMSEIENDIFTAISYAKPLQGIKLVEGKPRRKDFLSENEWRFVARDFHMSLGQTDDMYRDPNQRRELNESGKQYVLSFSPSDIRYLFVKDDNDIPALFDFILTNMPQTDTAALKTLATRITSIEHLKQDV